eukprot:1351470-Amorphochlora_amoeboformis.AAC.1
MSKLVGHGRAEAYLKNAIMLGNTLSKSLESLEISRISRNLSKSLPSLSLSVRRDSLNNSAYVEDMVWLSRTILVIRVSNPSIRD